MKALLLILISISYGFLYAILFKYLKANHLLMFITSILLTLLYIFMVYKLNNGIINYILKLSLIGGFYIYYKLSNQLKKRKNK